MTKTNKSKIDAFILSNLPASYHELCISPDCTFKHKAVIDAMQRMRIAGQIEYDYIRKRGYVWRLVK